MKGAYTGFSTRETPQIQPIPGADQVKGRAGGYVFAVSDWSLLDRFLILGTEGGSYYVGEQELTASAANAVLRCIDEDGERVVNRIVEISDAGRAPKNDPALFALAIAASAGSVVTRRSAMDALPKVARTGTHLFSFVTYVQQFRGWGRVLRDGVAAWYTTKSPDDLAYQLIKYRQRGGWTHRDVMRKAHPKSPGSSWDKHGPLFTWAVKGYEGDEVPVPESNHSMRLIYAYERAQRAKTAQEVAQLIRDHNLPREAIPTNFLNKKVVWEALLTRMPLTALVRNLGKMTSIGLIAPMSGTMRHVADRLTNKDALVKARVHPIAMLVAMGAYKSGKSKGGLTWAPVPQVIDALDEGFYLAFGNVEPSGKRTYLALDVSGSMAYGNIAGTNITPREASAAMCLVTARVERDWYVAGFQEKLVNIFISPRQRLNDVIKTVTGLHFGGTDCALPMIDALEKRMPVDLFVVYTDSETWAGRIHPVQALKNYRDRMGIPAKLVVVGMTADKFSIADPSDPGMLDVVGFDTATPNVISEFAKM